MSEPSMPPVETDARHDPQRSNHIGLIRALLLCFVWGKIYRPSTLRLFHRCLANKKKGSIIIFLFTVYF